MKPATHSIALGTLNTDEQTFYDGLLARGTRPDDAAEQVYQARMLVKADRKSEPHVVAEGPTEAPADDRPRQLLRSLVGKWHTLTPEQRTEALELKRRLESGSHPPVAEPAAPPPPVETPPTPAAEIGRGLRIAGKSFTNGLALLLGAPSDLAELALAGLSGLNEMQVTGAGWPTINLPMGGQELIDALPEGLKVDETKTGRERVLSRTIQELGSVAIPIAASVKLLSHIDPRKLVQLQTRLAAAAGVTAGAFKEGYDALLQDIFPDQGPVADFIGELVGSFGATTVMKLAGKAKEVAIAMTGLRSTKDIEKEIGTELGKLATPEQVKAGLEKTEALQKEIPELKPTTAQAIGTPGLVQAERGFQRSSTEQGGKAKTTLQQNRAVVRNYLEQGAPEGNLSETVKAIEATRTQESAMLDAGLIRAQAEVDAAKNKTSLTTERIVQQADTRAAVAEDRAQARINALRNRITEGEAGRILREEYGKELAEFNTLAEQKYATVDPGRAIAVNTDDLSRELAAWRADVGVELQPPAGRALQKINAVIPDVEREARAAGFVVGEPAPTGPRTTTFTELHQARNEVRRLHREALADRDFKSARQLTEIEDRLQETMNTTKASAPTSPEMADAIARLQQADDFYAKGSQRLKAGEAGALRYKDKWGRFVTADEDVAARFLAGETPVNDFVQALGSRASAREALIEYAKLDFTKKVVNPDPSINKINPAAAARWLRDHEDALKQFPELREAMGDATKMQKVADELRKEADAIAKSPEKVARVQNPKVFGELDEVTRRQADLLALRERKMADWQKSVASQLTGLDADRAAGAIIRNPRPNTMIHEVGKKIGNDPDGQAGFTRALWDASLDKFGTQLLDAAGNPVLQSKKMAKFLNDNEAWMLQRFGAERVARMRTSAKAMAMLDETGRPVLPGGSDTFANLSSVLTDWGPFLSRLYAERSGRASLRFIISERTARIIGKALKAETEESAAHLLEQAFYDPKVAQTFMLAAKNASEPLLRQRFRFHLLTIGGGPAGQEPEQPVAEAQ